MIRQNHPSGFVSVIFIYVMMFVFYVIAQNPCVSDIQKCGGLCKTSSTLSIVPYCFVFCATFFIFMVWNKQ